VNSPYADYGGYADRGAVSFVVAHNADSQYGWLSSSNSFLGAARNNERIGLGEC
jgi:hypothetical protein